MVSRTRSQGSPQRRRGAVAVQFALLATALFGFVALSIDVGAMHVAKSELQRAADSAALAAAAKLSDYSTNNPQQLATEAAMEYAARNTVLKSGPLLQEGQDIEFGHATCDSHTGKFSFVKGGSFPDAVRVHVRRTAGSPNGPMSLYFARIFGVRATNLQASATAVLVPRDIAIVADLSGSHTDDSELQHYTITDINLYDVWAALPIEKGNNGVGNGFDPQPPGNPTINDGEGTSPGNPGNQGGNETPGADPQNPVLAGPRWGYFMGWEGFGTMTIDANYDPTADPGLLYLPYNQSWSTNQVAQTILTQRGYSSQEITALLSNSYDTSESGKAVWENRVAVVLGLASWNSGIPGGLWSTAKKPQAVGNANSYVGTNEITWMQEYPFAAGSWREYFDNYVASTSTTMYGANSAFRYRFGVKTFMNYLLENRPGNADTPELAGTPTQPMQAVKDAVAHMMDVVEDLDSEDAVSLEIYAQTAHHEVDLTHTYSEVSDRLNAMQAAHYDSWTNMAGGIIRGYQELTGVRGRPNAAKTMILLTDGKPNVNRDGNGSNSYESIAAEWAKSEAAVARSMGIRIYTVSVGADANTQLMEEIAQIGDGEHMHAAGSIQDYSAQLDAIFERLGGKRPAMLIE
jgi:hypothetical protein